MKWSQIMDESAMIVGDQLMAKADECRANGAHIYPPRDQVFRALQLTPPDAVKVCIIGQDPYHTPGAANGLAFSINNGNPVQPSLHNIFEELCYDIKCPMPTTSDLTPWAEQGVLLLNAALTVEEGLAASHSEWGWDKFTGEVFRLCFQLPQPVVFILWGSNAQRLAKTAGIDQSKPHKFIISSAHPSPLSAYRGFFGSRPFSRANAFLCEHGVQPIQWALP